MLADRETVKENRQGIVVQKGEGIHSVRGNKSHFLLKLSLFLFLHVPFDLVIFYITEERRTQ